MGRPPREWVGSRRLIASIHFLFAHSGRKKKTPQADQAGAMHAIPCIADAGNRESLARDGFRRLRLDPPGDARESLALLGENAAPR
jgi:hypothetical protein